MTKKKLFLVAKFQYLFLLFSLSLITFLEAGDLDCEEAEHLEGPLFVSLGSYCEPAHMLRFCELRKAAFPFDWIVSFDGEALIRILDNNFADFLNDCKLIPYEKGGALLHIEYHLEFLHDGDWRGNGYWHHMNAFQSKYERRIERFRNLDLHKGKVFFLRCSSIYSTTDPHRFFKSENNLEISEEYASKLERALKRFFPHLDFTLVIINHAPCLEIEFENRGHSRLFFVRRDTSYKYSEDISRMQMFFSRLLSYQNESH